MEISRLVYMWLWKLKRIPYFKILTSFEMLKLGFSILEAQNITWMSCSRVDWGSVGRWRITILGNPNNMKYKLDFLVLWRVSELLFQSSIPAKSHHKNLIVYFNPSQYHCVSNACIRINIRFSFPCLIKVEWFSNS